MEWPAGPAPAPPTWQAGMPLTTPWPRLELRAGLAPACDEVAARRLSISVQRSGRSDGGDGADRTRATVVGHGLANRPVTTPARLLVWYPRQDSNLHQAAFVARCPSF